MFNFIVRYYGHSIICYIMPPYFKTVTLTCPYTQNVPGQNGRMQLAKCRRPGYTYPLIALEEVILSKVIRKVEQPGNRRCFKSSNVQCMEPGIINNCASWITTLTLASQEKWGKPDHSLNSKRKLVKEVLKTSPPISQHNKYYLKTTLPLNNSFFIKAFFIFYFSLFTDWLLLQTENRSLFEREETWWNAQQECQYDIACKRSLKHFSEKFYVTDILLS